MTDRSLFALSPSAAPPRALSRRWRAWALALALASAATPWPVVAAEATSGADTGACSTATALLFDACGRSAGASLLVAQARCVNQHGAEGRQACYDDAKTAHSDALALCAGQRDIRGTACGLLGEQRYDPAFKPGRFDRDPRMPSHPNVYFPLALGYHWEFSGGGQTNTIDVLDQTVLAEGVRCVVMRDLVYTKGRLTEATDDWIATGRDGSVWYCGEEVKEYEYVHGDHPNTGELVNIDGSFKHGRGGAKAGTLMLATPTVGMAYREEFAPANAEDIAQVLSTTYAYGADTDLDRDVPRALAEFLCAAGDCLVTQNYSMLSPSDIERKYYARGIGVFVETTVGQGLSSQLTGCNVDPRCASLPPH